MFNIVIRFILTSIVPIVAGSCVLPLIDINHSFTLWQQASFTLIVIVIFNLHYWLRVLANAVKA